MFRPHESQAFSTADLQGVFLPDLVGLSPHTISPSSSFPTLPQDDQATLPDLAILNEDIPSPPPSEKPQTHVSPSFKHPPTLVRHSNSATHTFSPSRQPIPTTTSVSTPPLLHIAKGSQVTSSSGLTPIAKSPLRKRRDHHNTHTRRCRARLNSRFDSLSRMLPLSASEPRQKVHILDRAIQALTALHADNDRLARTLALRSQSRMLQWIETFTRPATNFSSAIAPLAKLVCELANFPYAELWTRETEEDSVAHLQDAFLHAPAILHSSLSALADVSRGLQVPTIELANATFERCTPNWFPVSAELHHERRTRLSDARIRSGFAVPVPVSGCMTNILVFYDVKERQTDVEVERVATFGAVNIGNFYGCPARASGPK